MLRLELEKLAVDFTVLEPLDRGPQKLFRCSRMNWTERKSGGMFALPDLDERHELG